MEPLFYLYHLYLRRRCIPYNAFEKWYKKLLHFGVCITMRGDQTIYKFKSYYDMIIVRRNEYKVRIKFLY